jgi:hypothetical protein
LLHSYFNRAAGRLRQLADGALFFARRLDCFIMTRQLSSIYLDLVHLDNFIMTRNCSSIYRDWQKTRHRDADSNSINPLGRYV